MKYKYITIEQSRKETGGQWCYRIINNKSNDPLGSIFWYAPWRQYVSEFTMGCIFNKSCLLDVIDFIDKHAGKAEG